MKTEFQRWYGCEESDRLDVIDVVAARLGMHVMVPEGVLDPVDIDAILENTEAARPGVYMLKSMSGWPDVRNGYAPYIVGAWYVWVCDADPSECYPTLENFERGLGVG